MNRTVLVIPCYNEEERFHPSEFLGFLGPRPWANFLFVNDGSEDRTDLVLRRVVDACAERARIVTLPENRGKAEAVRAGVNAALEGGPEYVGFWDADLATPLAVADAFRALLEEQPALQAVIGSRVRLLGRDIDRRPHRHYLGRIFATAASFFLRIPVYDTQCGAKLFRNSSALQSAFAMPFQSNWIFDVELLARLTRTDAFKQQNQSPPIAEFPLHAWTDVAGSKIRLTHLGQILIDALRLIRAYPPIRRSNS